MSAYHKSVSIIIPNYNGVALLEKYLTGTMRSVKKTGVSFEVIVVDDCSTDSSVNWIRANYPEVNLLVNPTNMGFSVTCNRGIAVAKNELVLLLNNDVSLSEDYFENLWTYFQDPETFGVMGRIVNSDNKIEDAARRLCFSGLKFKASRFFYFKNPHQRTPTAYLSGANALVRRAMLVRLGGFDEVFSPYYCEDVDLSFRAWSLGWRCYYEHQAICHHEVSSTIRSTVAKKELLAVVYRNKFILHAIHLNGLGLILWFCQMMIFDVIFRVLLGKFWIIKSLREFFSRKKEVLESRRKLKMLHGNGKQRLSLQKVKKKYFDSIQAREVESI